MSYARFIYQTLVLGNQKAIVGFVLTAVIAVISRVGLHSDMTVAEAIRTLVEAGIVAGGVWLQENK